MEAAVSDSLENLREENGGSGVEFCACSGEQPIKLMQALSKNPIHCMTCNRSAQLDGLGLDEGTVQLVVRYRNVFDAIDRLWLDSRPYEEWARAQLADLTSAVNTMGREAQRALDEFRRCFYWCFQDEDAPDYAPRSTCPGCDGELRMYADGIRDEVVCDACSLVLAGWP